MKCCIMQFFIRVLSILFAKTETIFRERSVAKIILYIAGIMLGWTSSEDASYEENTSIFDEVFKYIDSTQRFSTFEDMFDTSSED